MVEKVGKVKVGNEGKERQKIVKVKKVVVVGEKLRRESRAEIKH